LGIHKINAETGNIQTAPIFSTIKRMARATEMNIKALLIEKERSEYIGGNTVIATFLSNVLDYIVELEEKVNENDGATEKERDRICEALMKLHNSKARQHNYFHWLANELREGRL
jgi:flagellar biosynthesis chaperone FliJ